MRWFVLALIAVFAIGCAKEMEADIPEEESAAATEYEGGGFDEREEVGVVSPGAGGVAPVTNPQSVQGAGGGGVGSAAKDLAKRKAGGTAATSLDQLDKSL